jgi:hypothetical protein
MPPLEIRVRTLQAEEVHSLVNDGTALTMAAAASAFPHRLDPDKLPQVAL